MSLLRNIVSDLVEKRLWPIAVALLVALAAVPFVLGGGDEPVAPVAALPGTPVDGTGDAAGAGITATEDTGLRGSYDKNDPFRKRPVPRVRTTPTPSATTGGSTGGTSAGAGASGGSGSGSTGSGSTGSGSGSTGSGLGDVGVVPVGGDDSGSGSGSGSGSSGSGSKSSGKDTWRVDLRFGKDGALSAKTNVARLSPLPSQSDPFFIFLGVQADGKTALFLVSSDATATGDGSCTPTPQNCDRVGLKEGETEFFDVVTPEGQTVQYQLDLVNVERETKADAAVASAARARESKAGRAALRTAVDTGQVKVADLAYSKDLGLVVPSGDAATASGALFGGYRVDLQFGAPGALVKRYNLARLTPLPSVDDPSFVYLGVLGDGATALFLNPSRAIAAGDAVCEPSPEQCDRVKLTEGQRATFAATKPDGGAASEYELQIDGIEPVRSSSEADAEASRTRESPAGRVILRKLINEAGALVQGLTFSGEHGTLTQDPADTSAAAAPASADAPAPASTTAAPAPAPAG